MPLSPSPETRASLLIRLKDRADQALLTEFVEIYQPVIRQSVLRRGMSSADTEDVNAYIENQAEHHRKKTFKEELEAILKKHAMDYEDWMLD